MLRTRIFALSAAKIGAEHVPGIVPFHTARCAGVT
jgi:hypothetical protein